MTTTDDGLATGLTVTAWPGVPPRLLRIPDTTEVEDHPAYLNSGGYQELDDPDGLLEEVDRSGLLGRGGAAFPLAVQLRTVRAAGRAGRGGVGPAGSGECVCTDPGGARVRRRGEGRHGIGRSGTRVLFARSVLRGASVRPVVASVPILARFSVAPARLRRVIEPGRSIALMPAVLRPGPRRVLRAGVVQFDPETVDADAVGLEGLFELGQAGLKQVACLRVVGLEGRLDAPALHAEVDFEIT